MTADHTVIDLDFYPTVEELMEVGAEKLKEVQFSSFPFFPFLFITNNNNNNKP